MKTIKELSEELGVSKVAIVKKTERLNIKNKLVRDGNRLLVPEELESTIRKAFNKPPTDNQTDNTQKETDNITQTLIGMLQKELEEKNKQIESLQTIINQEQSLRLITEQKLLALEQKEQKEDDNQEVKPGFWSRLFGKKKTESTDTGTPTEDTATAQDQEGNK